MPIYKASSTRSITGSYACARTSLTGAAGTQFILTIECPVSTVNVYVKRVTISITTNGATALTNYIYSLGRTTGLPTGGTTLTAQKKTTAFPAAAAIVRTAPTVTAATGSMINVQGSIYQNNTADVARLVEVFNNVGGSELDDIVLVNGEGLLLSATGNDVDIQHIVSIEWQEGIG